MKFISKKIRVVEDGSPKRPARFYWDETEYVVTEVIAQWQDWGFSEGAGTRNWRNRRHRNCYHVKTADGSEFELYLDRGAKLTGGDWFLLSKLK